MSHLPRPNDHHGRVLLFAALASITAMGGCNTIRGMGQDTQAGGRAVERTAKDTQQQMEEKDRNKDPNAAATSSSPQ